MKSRVASPDILDCYIAEAYQEISCSPGLQSFLVGPLGAERCGRSRIRCTSGEQYCLDRTSARTLDPDILDQYTHGGTPWIQALTGLAVVLSGVHLVQRGEVGAQPLAHGRLPKVQAGALQHDRAAGGAPSPC